MKKAIKIAISCTLTTMIFVAGHLSVSADPIAVVNPTVKCIKKLEL